MIFPDLLCATQKDESSVDAPRHPSWSHAYVRWVLQKLLTTTLVSSANLIFSVYKIVWFGVKFTPGGHSTFFGLLNTAVHIVMYVLDTMECFAPFITQNCCIPGIRIIYLPRWARNTRNTCGGKNTSPVSRW